MNYKWFFKRVWRLITSPVKTWEEIAGEKESRNLFSDFFYPLIGFCGMILFGVFLFNKWIEEPGIPVNQMVQGALMEAAEIFIAFVGGYFVSIWVIHWLNFRILDLNTGGMWLSTLIGYSMTVPILLRTTAGIFSSFILLQWIFQFYTLYMVWEGSKKISPIKDDKRLSFSILAALVLIAIPNLIGFAFRKFTFILN